MRKRVFNWSGAVFNGAILLGFFVLFLVFHPASPLPREWNPSRALAIADPVTPITSWKLQRALADGETCMAALATASVFTPLPNYEKSETCHIRDQVLLAAVSDAKISPLRTRCQTALRLAMWREHGIGPAARAHFGQDVTHISHLASYNCRRIRTPSGRSERMSSHATAEAVDITGVTLSNGRKLTLLKDWESTDPQAQAFLRDIHVSSCTWFRTSLGPEFNALHANHFHLQHVGWGTCR